MPRSTVCPQCDVELFISDEACGGAWAQCPRCRAVFELDTAALRPLAEAMLVDGPPPPREEPTADDKLVRRPHATTLADLMPPSEPDDQPAELPDDFSEPELVEEAPAVSTTGWSEGVDRLDEWLKRVDREAAASAVSADAPPADSPAEAGRLVDVHEPIAVSSTPGPRRKRSALRTLVGITLGGAFALAAGYYLLLVLGGPDADALQLAQYVPSRLLPDSFRSEPVAPTSTPTAPLHPANEEVAVAPSSDKTAEVPASFVAPAEPSKETAVDDRYAADRAAGDATPAEAPRAQSTTPAEPLQFDETAALPLSAVEPRVMDAPSYTADQLRSALASARQAQAGLVDGDLNDPGVLRTKGVSYTRFCELAEVLTYAETEPRSEEITILQQEAEQLIAETLTDANTRAEVARIAAIWITSPNRRRDGVLLTGKVISRSTLGSVDECQLDTGSDSRITILVPSRIANALDTGKPELGVVGAIVKAPGERISGYTGSSPQAVWVHRVVPLP